MAAAAALAGWTWGSLARTEAPSRVPAAVLVAAWALCSGAARLFATIPGPLGQQSSDLLQVFGSGCALLALLLVLHGLAERVSGPGADLAEAVLLATCAVTVLWVITAAPTRLEGSALFSVVPPLLDASGIALVLRSTIVAGEVRHGSAEARRFWLVSAVAILLINLGDALRCLDHFGSRVPAWVVAVVTVAGYLLAAALARLSMPPPPTVEDEGRRRRRVPYLLAALASLTVGLQLLLGGTGPVPLVLLILAVTALVAMQAFMLYESDQVLTALGLSRQRLATLVENTTDLLVWLDGNGRILTVNAAAIRLLHRTPSSVQGRSFEDLARAEDRRRVREMVLEVARGRRDSAEVEFGLCAPAAGTAQLRLRAVPNGAVANLSDVTDSVELRQRLERMARYDPMTGLVNRGHLLEVIGAWLSGPEVNVAVLYADLDGFKPVNDRFGHATGDRVLSEVAARFDSVAGAVDARRVIIGRVGGDEFIMALEGSSARAAELAGQYLVEAINPTFTVGDRTVQLGVSVGIAGSGPAHSVLDENVPVGETGASELIHRADLAMYAAKGAGRAQVARWHPELEEQVRRRIDLAIGLRAALELGQLTVAYQPIVRLADGLVLGSEALLRLPAGADPQALAPGLDALVSPAELVEIAEDTGTITEMGEWVLAQAAYQGAEWARAGYQCTVSVNMSVQQLVSAGFVDSVQAILASCDLHPSRLVLELTEGQLVGQGSPAVEALVQLRALGIRLAIDDFGTGYSSLSYLRRMPVQVLKVDRALLQDVGVDPRATSLARSVVAMSRDLGLLVVVEGLEDLESVRLLRELGADAGQGFALSPALPAAEMTAVLNRAVIDVGLELANAELTED
jgi:diguanylate cyclase (GGDEF)-like protein/PAS domain S-box-containing protein